MQAVLRRVSGTDVTVTALHLASTWTDRSQQATTYRKGRVLLAGDAAHIHSPLGGQGLNLGLGDAMNLGWKLAATIRGDAPDGLLDSYTTERHPIGARILDWTRAQVALMRPDRTRARSQAVVRDLIATRDGATYFAERVWGVSLRYDLGDEHPLVGRSCPDFELEDGTRVGALLRDGRGLLLDFGRQASLASARWPLGRPGQVRGQRRQGSPRACARCSCAPTGSSRGRATRRPSRRRHTSRRKVVHTARRIPTTPVKEMSADRHL